VRGEADHDQEARRDHGGAEPHEHRLPAPDEVDHVADRHLHRPGDAGPERKRGEELRRQVEVVLDEERADDAGQPGYPVRRVDHQRREVRNSKHRYSAWILLSFTTLPHRAMFSAIHFCVASGPSATTSMPSVSVSVLLTSGCFSVLFSSATSLSTIGRGVPAGARMPQNA